MTTSSRRKRTIGICAALSLGVGALVGGLVDSPRLEAATGAVASSVVTVEPTRVLDTRFGTGLAGPISANANNTLQITGSIPTRVGDTDTNATVVPGGATGVLLNVTALRPTAAGFLSIRPGDATGEPSASNLNFGVGAIVPNAVTVALADDGSIDIWYGTGTAGASTGVLIDIVGYTTEATGGGATGPAGPAGPTGPTGPAGSAGADGTDLYERTIIVGSDGSPSSNGSALISAAASVVGESDDPWVIELEPGTYDLGSATLAIGDYESIRGAGPELSVVTSSSTASVIDVGDGSTLSEMTIDGTGITTSTASGVVRIDNVDAVALSDVALTSTGRGILIEQSTGTTIDRIDITAVGYAVNLDELVPDLVVRDSTIVSTGDSGLDLGFSNSATTVDNSVIEATGADQSAVRSAGGDGILRHTTLISATGGSVESASGNTDVEIVQTHVDVNDSFATHFTGGVAACVALSAPGSFSATTCI